jgi:hypothetical protein
VTPINDTLRVAQTLEQLIVAAPLAQYVGGSQRSGVQFQLLDCEDRPVQWGLGGIGLVKTRRPG